MQYRFLSDFNYSSLLRSFIGLEYWYWQWWSPIGLKLVTGDIDNSTVLPGLVISLTNRVGPGNIELLYRSARGELGSLNHYSALSLMRQEGWLDALSVHQ